MTETLIDRIARHEGNIPVVYDDATGHPIVKGYTVQGNPTIGAGILLSAPGGLSPEERDYLLHNRVALCRQQVAEKLPWSVSLAQTQQEVLVEMAYQLGINGLLSFHAMLSCAQAGDDDGVAHSMLGSLWHRQTPSRCEELANLWLNGNQP